VKIGVEAARLGLRVNVPVSYNVELEFVLSAFEAVDKEISIRGRRWVAMHVVHATPDQMERIKALDMRITISPNYMYLFSDRFRLDKLDAEGLPFRELADAGIAVSLETDGVPHSLLWAMWETLARWDERAGRRRGEARLSRDEVLRLAIQNGHELTWNEDRFGSLEVGKQADVVVLADDPLTCPEDALKDIEVDLTLVGGRTVHQRLSDDEPAPLEVGSSGEPA
jgi:predicted amidohydrolase YtcJ